ncbi:MAG: ABC transporter substrate-binding protein [Acidobacteria bacterium]|jgi:ABC-type transport system substrate-binding protein|nr:ABC transporter substrate-binding protein [Acidobacteriota bacterium]
MACLKKVLLLSSALIAVLSCCGSPGGAPKAQAKNKPARIQAFILPQPRSLIPSEGQVFVDGQFTEIIFNNLVKANYLGSLAPELAESWTISPDHREYTFRLRRGVRFHDGRAFSAADVVFTLEQLILKASDKYAEIKCIEGYRDFLSGRAPRVSGLQPLDAQTVRIRLSKNFKFFLQFLAAEYAAIVPRDYAGLDEATFRDRPVGTGSFRLVGRETRTLRAQKFNVFRLERNPDYFAPSGNVAAIDFYSANTAIASPCKEAFDILLITHGEIPEFAAKPDFRVVNSSPNILNFLVLNPGENAQTRDRRVRQLINYGIDREELVEKVFRRQAVPAHSMMPFGQLGHNPYYRMDYSLAATIRAELPPGKIRFTILTLADERQLVAEHIARALARFNIEAQVIPVSDQYDYFTNRIYRTRTSVMLGGIPDYPAAYHFLTHLVEPNGYYNVFGFALPELNSRIDSLPSSQTMEETRSLAQISAALESEALYVPLYYNANFFAIRSRIRTVVFTYGEVLDFGSLEVVE